MYAAGMGKGVFTDDGFAALHHQAAHARDQARGLDNLARVQSAFKPAEEIVARFEGHDDFLHGGVAGALANAVDRAFDLPRPVAHGGQRVGHGQTEIIVAMDAQDGPAGLEFRRPNRKDVESARHIDPERPSPRCPGMLTVVAPAATTARQTCTKKSGSVRDASSGENSTSLAKRLRPFDALHRQPENFLPRLVQFKLPVNLRRGQKDMNASPLARGLDRCAGGVNVARARTGPIRKSPAP